MDAVRDGVAELHGEDARHLTRVLRAEAGGRYEISDNRSAWLAEVVEARGERIVFRAIEPVESVTPPARITLCAALIKFDRFEWIVEKATELGVERLIPVETARSEKGLLEASRKRAERWQRIARESSQQSRRLRVPEISGAVRFNNALSQEADYHYFLDEAAAPPLLRSLPERRASSDTLAALLGPEGGWTDDERRLACAAGWRPASLGPQVLRAETAATAVMAVLTSAWMA